MPRADVNCWRCGRKLLECAAPADVDVPEGVVIELPCSRCHARNHVRVRRLLGQERVEEPQLPLDEVKLVQAPA